MGHLAVEAHCLSKAFNARVIVDGISLSIPEGQIFGILGPNGAGKTTTLRMLLGILEPDAGTRTIFGLAPKKAAARIGYLPEERGLYQNMTPREMIAFLGSLRGVDLKTGRARADELMEHAGLGTVSRQPLRTLSKGMSQIVQFLGALVHRPALLVLDEPFSGLDPINQQRLEALIQDQVSHGVTVLFSTHMMAHAERLCERIVVLDRGKIRYEGSVDEARASLVPMVTLQTREDTPAWRNMLPSGAVLKDGQWQFPVPQEGIEPFLAALLSANAGILSLSIERPTLHEAFIDLISNRTVPSI